MSKVIMVQGTMSNAGKSLLVGGLCRVFRQDGYRVAPFKSQNMALNSFVTKDGLEMGRAQVMQAECAKTEPSVYMNPILLKPTNDIGSQVIVNGEVRGDMPAREYFKYKKKLVPDILNAFRKLSEENDIIVIEGAGSPAEINLMENDIVNMGMAEMVDAPVLLVGDIDRGGVFAQLYGTVKLLDKAYQDRIQGLIINKFRGDVTLLDSGIEMLEEMTGVPVIGTVPYRPLNIDDEDSLSTRLQGTAPGLVNIGVIRFPRISNFTDLAPFELIPGVGIRYITHPSEMQDVDFLILPGSKNTIGDLQWLRACGLADSILAFAQEKPVMGICGGYQMLGDWIHDPDGVEEGGSVSGLGLLPIETTLQPAKHREQVSGIICRDGIKSEYRGYEIHAGGTRVYGGEAFTWLGNESLSDSPAACDKVNGIRQGNVYGTYVHGIFDEGRIARDIAEALAERKHVELPPEDSGTFREIREEEYDKLADLVRENLDMKRIYEILREAKIQDCMKMENVENPSAAEPQDCKNTADSMIYVGSANSKETERKDEATSNFHFEHVLPGDIEKRSFQIIGEELAERGIEIPAEQDPITRRVIHTTADFDYATTMTYSKDALQIADRILRAGGDIVTDTNMTRSGINKKFLEKLGGQVHCFMADPDVAHEAKERGVTRATVSMERAAKLPGPVIISVGNAPTALISLCEIMKKSDWRPGLVIGVPVGFVNVVPAKEMIMESGVPYIVNHGRKGGSNVAAAICNALLYRIRDGITDGIAENPAKDITK